MFRQSNQSKKIALLFFILTILAWSVLFYFINPIEIVELIGINNSYLIIFFVAFLGSVSTFATITAYTAIATLTIGGLNIFVLSLIAGIGATLGDTFLFYFGFKSRQYIHGKLENILKKIAFWIKKRPPWFLSAFVYLYSGFAPAPNGIMILTLALSGYNYKYILLPNLLGNITFMLILAYLSIKGF